MTNSRDIALIQPIVQNVDRTAEQFHTEDRVGVVETLVPQQIFRLSPIRTPVAELTKSTPKKAPPFLISSITVPTMIWIFFEAGRNRMERKINNILHALMPSQSERKGICFSGKSKSLHEIHR